MRHIIYYAYVGDASADAATLADRMSYIEAQLAWLKMCISRERSEGFSVTVAATCPISHDVVFSDIVKSFDFSMYPVISRENTFEHHGFVCLMDIASKIGPSEYIFYSHSKGCVNRSDVARGVFKTHTALLIDEAVFLEAPDNIEKIGLFPSEKGWMWHNFFWIRSSALLKKNLIVSNDRYYYESFIGDFNNPFAYFSSYAYRPNCLDVDGFAKQPFYEPVNLIGNSVLYSLYRHFDLKRSFMGLNKWYFCLSEASIERDNHGWREMVLAAVNSCRVNTNLRPILLFDGEEIPFLQVLRNKGVEVIFHRVSIYDALVKKDKNSPGYLAVASGAFLRIDIPLIENEDDYVLYTDCDVLFLGGVADLDIKPNLFACAPQASKTDYENDANSGVLLLNVRNMRKTHADFCKFIVDNLDKGWPGCDQENYRRFYANQWDRLPLVANWKPYWGYQENIKIVHWHGPKPEAIFKKLSNESFILYDAWQELFDKNKEAYSKFFDVWDRYCDQKIKYLLESKSEVRGSIDAFGISSDNVTLSGWSYLKGTIGIDRYEIRFGSSVYKFTHCSTVIRPDVQRVHASCSNDCGFSLTFALAPGSARNNSALTLIFINEKSNMTETISYFVK